MQGCTNVAEHMDVRERRVAKGQEFADKSAPTDGPFKPLPAVLTGGPHLRKPFVVSRRLAGFHANAVLGHDGIGAFPRIPYCIVADVPDGQGSATVEPYL